MGADFRQWRIADHTMHGGIGAVPCDYLQVDLDPRDFVQSDLFPTLRSIARTHFSAVHLERIFINAFQFGDMNYIHSDYISGRPGVSLVMFANSYWEKDWGGELFFYSQDREALCAVSPRPGRIVAFSNDVLHRPGIPNRIAPKPRVTLNVRFYQ